MRKNALYKTLALLGIFAILLGACGSATQTPDPVILSAVAMTVAAQTIVAQLTAVVPLSTATIPVIVPNTNTPIPLPPTAIPSATSLPATATATPTCDLGKFISDVTIPDGTVMTPNQTFTKTWRLQNIGTCSWTGYSLVFDSGEAMGGAASSAIGTTAPNGTIDISINLTAPSTPSDYRGYWRIRSASGVLFPIVNGYQGRSFYVDIEVQNAVTATNTPVSAADFAVTSITYSVSTWSSGGSENCPRIIAHITTNGVGTVTYTWTSTSDTNSPETLDFGSAGTKTINYDWPRASTWAGTPAAVGIYINSPNHQDFGQQAFTTACTTP
jgi:hypothetical protein